MRNLRHYPKLNTQAAIAHYREEDVKYVCTTELKLDGIPYDIFYRSTKHPVYENHYFGLYRDPMGQIWIVNADSVEDLSFTCIDNGFDEWTYSQHRHDFVSWGNKAIDGGRSYSRFVYDGPVPQIRVFVVKNGECVETLA